jgi:hypothetical protein
MIKYDLYYTISSGYIYKYMNEFPPAEIAAPTAGEHRRHSDPTKAVAHGA